MKLISRWLLVVLCIVTSLCSGPSGAQSKVKAAAWRDNQEKWWKAGESLFSGIVTLAHAKPLSTSENPKLAGEITDSLIDLLVLFDADNSSSALNSLTKLSAYYLGEAPGEVYGCIVERKGTKILPYLQKALQPGSVDDCVARYGQKSTMCVATKGASARTEKIESLIEKIKSDTPCAIER
jgi:hypothetical protein